MKTRLAIIIALASAGVSVGAYAQLPGDVPAPSVGMSGKAPSLYPSEQGAFKALEVATQVVESRIQQKGCYPASFPLSVNTGSNGSGTAKVDGVKLSVSFLSARNGDGRRYSVTGSGTLGGLTVSNINGQGSFNIGSTIQELSTNWNTTSYVQGNVVPGDRFYGTIIKDYWRLEQLQSIPSGFEDAGIPVSTVVDYGYQQISKNGYVKAKYWQQSRFWREDGVNAGTHWVKTRVTPKDSCKIVVHLEGYGVWPADNLEGFNEKGTISVVAPNVGPYKM